MLSTLPVISRSPRAIYQRSIETSSSSSKEIFNLTDLWSFKEYEHYASDFSSSTQFPITSAAANHFASSCLSSMDPEILNKALPHPSTFFRKDTYSFFSKLGEITVPTSTQRNDQWADMNPDILANMASSYLNLED